MKNYILVLIFTSVACFSQEMTNVSENKRDKRLFFVLDYGFGLRTAKLPKGLTTIEKSYIKELKSGNTLDFKIGYKKNFNTILGLTYSIYNSKGILNNTNYIEPNGFSGVGNVSDNITISFVGLGGGIFEKGFRKDDTVLFDIYLGYINYKNEIKYANNYKFKGGNLGISTSLSYYVGVSPSIKFGPAISFNGGAIKKLNIKGENGYSGTFEFDKDTFESLYRFDFMIGTLIRF